MSIINDALKKTQSTFSENKPTMPTIDETIVASHRAPARVYSKRMLFFIVSACALTFCVLIWHSYLLSVFRGEFHTQPKMIQKIAVQQPIVLNGTLQTNQARAALINHQLYHVGDMIEGYQIKQINYNGVVLLNPKTHNTRLITLTMQS